MVARTRSRTISRATAGASVRSVACRTLTSLFICLMTCERSCGSTSTTMLMRESVGSSVLATVRLSMLKPRAVSTPVTRINAPGLFSTSREMICSISGIPDLLADRHRLRGTQHHLVDRGAGGNHRIDVFERRHADIQQIRPGRADGGFERGPQIAPACSTVRPGNP